MEIAEFALGVIGGLVTNVIQAGVNLAVMPYFQRRRIQRRVDDATAEVVEPLLPFLAQEGVPEDKQRRLIQTCADELRPLTEQPALLFQASLNGQQIFDDLYADRELPQTVVEDGLKDTYALLCPRIATLLCKIPAAVKDWENEAWSENYRRLDELSQQMRNLFSKVDNLATGPSREADETLNTVRRSLAQKIGFELDLTGLRADRPLAGRFDDFFVHPELQEVVERGKKETDLKRIGSPDEAFQVFAQGRSLAIVTAAPGGGKSTWAKWLQREALSARWSGIGIRVELRRFTDVRLLSLYELIRESAGRHLAEELTVEGIIRWLEAKQVVFILDGFDEIQPTERDRVYEWVVELATAARGCPFVVTSRPLTTSHLDRLGHRWKRWTIEPFDQSRILDYIKRWYAHTPLLADTDRHINTDSLASSWANDPTIGPLTGNPLLLSTVLMVHHLDGSLPSGRSQLYRRYVEGMLGLWDDRRQVSATTVHLSLEQRRTIMRAFALHMFLRGEDQLDEEATLSWMDEFLKKQSIILQKEDVLSSLRERSGLIIGPGIYSFAHKSIAEYFVAETILQGDQEDDSGRRMDRFRLFESRNDDRWNTVTFLWAGLAPIVDLEAFIDACLEANAYSLALGILFDQYERIARDARRRVFFKFLESGNEVELKNVEWIVSHPSNLRSVALMVPTIDLRLLTPRGDFLSLIERAISDKTLVASDITRGRGRLKETIWMQFVALPQSVEEWKLALEIGPPDDGASRQLWHFWAGQRVLLAITNHEIPLRLPDVIRTYSGCFPELAGLIPLMIMSVVIITNSGKYGSTRNKAELSSAISQLLELLPTIDGKPLPDWLVGTREWTLGFGGLRVCDLMDSFIENVDKLFHREIPDDSGTYSKAIGFAHELIAKRDGLESQLELRLI